MGAELLARPARAVRGASRGLVQPIRPRAGGRPTLTLSLRQETIKLFQRAAADGTPAGFVLFRGLFRGLIVSDIHARPESEDLVVDVREQSRSADRIDIEIAVPEYRLGVGMMQAPRGWRGYAALSWRWQAEADTSPTALLTIAAASSLFLSPVERQVLLRRLAHDPSGREIGGRDLLPLFYVNPGARLWRYSYREIGKQDLSHGVAVAEPSGGTIIKILPPGGTAHFSLRRIYEIASVAFGVE
jgi:hypothetical protein